jgi:hypothetical protein
MVGENDGTLQYKHSSSGSSSADVFARLEFNAFEQTRQRRALLYI